MACADWRTRCGVQLNLLVTEGVWACENKETLKTILKGYYNFSGFVVSDWGACHSLVDSINGGIYFILFLDPTFLTILSIFHPRVPSFPKKNQKSN